MFSLLTGGSGFVGSALAARLARDGDPVRCLVRAASSTRALAMHPSVELVRQDLATADESALIEALRGVDTVFHLAALVRARDAAEYQRVNVDATLRLYRAFSRVAPAGARFVFCSSLAATGPSRDGRPVDERSPLRPVSDYGRSKLAAEQALADLDGPPRTIVRPPTVYGPRDRAVLPLFQMAKRGVLVCIGSQRRQYSVIHVEDLAEAFVQAARSRAGVGTWFVEDGGIHAWSDLAAALEHACGRRTVRLTVPDLAVRALAPLLELTAKAMHRPPLTTRERSRDLTAPSWICSSAAARAAFGFAPRWTLRDGMAQTAHWYRENGWL